MKYPFPQNKPLQGLSVAFVLVLLWLVSVLLITLLLKATLPVFFGIADPTSFMTSPDMQVANPMASLYLQALLSPIGSFLIPALAFHSFFRMDIPDRLQLRTIPPFRYWLISIVIMVAAGVFIQLLVQIMQIVPLPAQLQSLRSSSETITKLVDSFFAQRSPFHFALLVLVMAVLPAVGEEVFFRGTVMNLLREFSFSALAAILISALAFSAMHMQFDNLLAIWCMGIVLGLVYYYTGSLWVSIAVHFLNNFMVVAGKYAYMSGTLQSDITSSETLPLYYTIPAGFVMVGGLVILSKWTGKKVTDLPN